jgi:predicted metalloprotease with PDZ domain
MPEPISTSELLYVIRFSEPAHHVIDVTLWIPVSVPAVTKFSFPVWTPGSYMVREYTRNIEAIFAWATGELGGTVIRQLELQRKGKNCWQVETAEGDRWVSVQYRLYCREMSVRTNWVERDFGFLTGAATFPLVDGYESCPLALELLVPPSWRSIATSLSEIQVESPVETTSGDSYLTRHRFVARDFDELVDSPVVAGDFETHQFEVGEKNHRLANVGGGDLWNIPQAVADVRTIVAEHQSFWGEVPYEDYLFINLNTESRGGLEHDNSSVLMCSRWTMRRRETYLDWLALVSHEFFHTWNVRRLRPAELMRYDYSQEQYFEELWIAEGITSYFDDLALVRTGLCTCDEYLARLSKSIQTVQSSPGRLVQGLIDASWDTWTKHYRPDENSTNARISYYLKGAVLAWLLDVEIQRQTEMASRLDHVMQQLWKQHKAGGYTVDDFERIVCQLGSPEIKAWLNEHARQPLELDFSAALNWFGLQFKPDDSVKKGNAARAWIGSQSTASDGRLIVRSVVRGSPSDRAGLNVEDELIALDGYRLVPDAWPSRLELYSPGQELELLIARRGKLERLKLQLGNRPSHNWELGFAPNGSVEAIERRRQWLRL